MHLDAQIVPVHLDTDIITSPQLALEEPLGVGLGPPAQPSTPNSPRPETETSFLLPSVSLLPESFHTHHFTSMRSGISYQLSSLLLGNEICLPVFFFFSLLQEGPLEYVSYTVMEHTF